MKFQISNFWKKKLQCIDLNKNAFKIKKLQSTLWNVIFTITSFVFSLSLLDCVQNKGLILNKANYYVVICVSLRNEKKTLMVTVLIVRTFAWIKTIKYLSQCIFNYFHSLHIIFMQRATKYSSENLHRKYLNPSLVQ